MNVFLVQADPVILSGLDFFKPYLRLLIIASLLTKSSHYFIQQHLGLDLGILKLRAGISKLE